MGKVKVPSLSRAGVDYEVERLARGGYVCDCLRFEQGRKGCSHVLLAERAHDAMVRCRAVGHEVRGGLCGACLVRLLAETEMLARARVRAATLAERDRVKAMVSARRKKKRPASTTSGGRRRARAPVPAGDGA